MCSTTSGVAVLLALVASMHTATAQPRSNPAADSLYDEGKKLYQSAEAAQSPAGFEPACAKFEASLKIDSEFVEARGYLALCYERAGRLATAWAEFRKLRSSALRKGLPDAVAVADQHISTLEPKLAKITLRLPSSPPSGLTIKQDGVVVPPESFNSPLAIDRGDHVYLAEAPGFAAASQTVSIVDGESKDIVIPSLIPTAPTSPSNDAAQEPTGMSSDPSNPPVDAKASTGMSTKRKASIVVGSVGIAAIAVGLGFGFKARSQWNDAHSSGHCTSNDVCDDAGIKLTDDAYGSARISTIAVGVGLGALGAATYLWITGSAPSEESRTAHIAPILHHDLVGALIQGRF